MNGERDQQAARLNGAGFDVTVMPGVPFRAGSAHVVPLGAIGVAEALGQPVPACNNCIKAPEQHGDLLIV